MSEKKYYRTRVRAKGQITVPGEVRDQLGAGEGDELAFYITSAGQVVVERLQVVPPEQSWFWQERWQKLEREVEADIEAGRVKHFSSIKEAMDALESAENAED